MSPIQASRGIFLLFCLEEEREPLGWSQAGEGRPEEDGVPGFLSLTDTGPQAPSRKGGSPLLPLPPPTLPSAYLPPPLLGCAVPVRAYRGPGGGRFQQYCFIIK